MKIKIEHESGKKVKVELSVSELEALGGIDSVAERLRAGAAPEHVPGPRVELESPPPAPDDRSADESLLHELMRLHTLEELPPLDAASKSGNLDENGLPCLIATYGNVPLADFKGERDIEFACIGFANMQAVASLSGCPGTWIKDGALYKFHQASRRFLYCVVYRRNIELSDEDLEIMDLDPVSVENWTDDASEEDFLDENPYETPQNSEYDASEADYEDDEDDF